MSIASGGALGAVALMMMVAPSAFGMVTYHAPYTGVVVKGAYSSQYGCATQHGSMTFSLGTGAASGSAAATAKTCAKTVGFVGKSSDGYNEPQIEAAVNVHLPSGAHHVAANWAMNAAAKGSESFGACPAPVPFKDTYTSHYGSYYYWDNYTGASIYCSADASIYGEIYGYLMDVSTGQEYNYSYHSFDSYMDSYNDSYWECYNYTTYNGTGYTYTHGCYGYNSTLHTYAYLNGVYYSTWTGPTNFNNTTSATFLMFANQTFIGTHHYAWVFEIYVEAAASVESWHALASASFNMATGGNGADLVKIVVT
ncbi:MAG TPA: hypothetical protein VGV89_09930 [Thermoplasmata archaeon]|nr:hypothetical protein [Thermoplasmata archaeon]